MKKLIIISGVIILITIYLFFSYSHIYDKNIRNSVSPYTTTTIFLPNFSSQKNINYIALGDSLSSGVGSSDYKKTITYIFADNLSQKTTVNFYNLAIPGATSESLINTQLENAIKLKPDYISLFIGINDIHSLVSGKKFEKNMTYILDKLAKETRAKIIVFNLPYLGSDQLILPPYNLFFDAKTQEFNSILKKICTNKNLTIVDLYTPTKEIFSKNTDFYSKDGFHPSEEGYLLWGSLLKDKSF